MNRENTQNVIKEIEAMLYLASELEIKELAKFYNINMEKMMENLGELEEKKEKSGINLKIEKGMVYFETNPKYGEAVHNFFNQESKPKKLSRAAMETLSIIFRTAAKHVMTASVFIGILMSIGEDWIIGTKKSDSVYLIN